MQPNRNRFEFVRVLFLIVIMLRSQPGARAMGARIRASRMCAAQIAQTAQPKGPRKICAAGWFLLQRSMAGGGVGPTGA